MNLEAIAPIIKKIIQDTLRERRYPFGFQGRTGLSNKVASGTLLNSVQVVKVQNEGIDTLELIMPGYGQFVNDGRLPGKKGIPVEAIKIWMQEKGIGVRDERGRFVKGNRQRTKNFNTGKGDVYPIAFAIQKNIQKFGIRQSGWIPIVMGKIEEDRKIRELLEGQAMADLIKILEQQ